MWLTFKDIIGVILFCGFFGFVAGALFMAWIKRD